MIVVVFSREDVVDEAVLFVESEDELEEAQREAEEMLDGRGPVRIEGKAELLEAWPILNGFTTMRAYVG